jgi:hypothetical protein
VGRFEIRLVFHGLSVRYSSRHALHRATIAQSRFVWLVAFSLPAHLRSMKADVIVVWLH